jgi:acetate kinase
VRLTPKKILFEEKSIHLIKEIKSAFKGLKNLKIAKTHFWQNLKNEAYVFFFFFNNIFLP